MPPEAIAFITAHGYLAIFILIFSQEIGIPNPVPNELVLMFTGYLSYKGILFLPAVILTAVIADLIGTSLLYFVFYYFGKYILAHKPRWLPVSKKTIDRLSLKVLNNGLWAIYLGRITPLIRGYTSVITGLLQVKPKVFMPIAIVSATTWSIVCTVTGRLLAPYWRWPAGTGYTGFFALLVVAVILLVFVSRYFKKQTAEKEEPAHDHS